VSVKIPVLTVVGLTFRDTLRFAIRHPTLLLVTLACSLPFEFARAIPEIDDIDRSTPLAFGMSWLLSTMIMLICLPAYFMAIRATLHSEAVTLSARQFLSESTRRYAIYSAGMMLVSELIAVIPIEALASASLAIVGRFAFTFVVVRTTLTFTALALGRLDLGFWESYRRTTGQTLRLFAVATLPPAILAVIAWAAMMVGALAGFDPTDPYADADARYFARVALGILLQVMALTVAVAGAEIYRLIEGAPAEPQNGRY
jgi:hypothetical protein